jgi:hypothetical protein
MKCDSIKHCRNREGTSPSSSPSFPPSGEGEREGDGMESRDSHEQMHCDDASVSQCTLPKRLE